MLSIIKVLAKDIAQNYKSTNYKDIEEQFDISRSRNFFPWGIFFADVFFLNKGFDIIIGNPPYVDSEEMTRSNKDLREVYKKYQSAKGNWDLYIPFIELGLRLLKENGIISYIVKNTLISSKYSEEIRNILLNFNFLELRDYSIVNVFKEADVYPIVFRLQKSNSKNATIKMTNMKSITDKSMESKINKSDFYKNIYWDCYFSKKENVEILKKLINQKTFGDNFVSTILSGCTVSEAYKIKERLKDNSNINKKYFKLINSGTIDPYTSFWGYKKTQYIKDSYDFPIVNKDDLKKISKKRYEISQKEKLIIANMTRGIECFYDYNMEYLAGKSTIVILKGKGGIPLEFLQGILNSKLINFFILIFFNSLKMSGGAINFGPQQLSLVPFPNNKKFLNEVCKLVININQLKEKNVDADISSQLFEIDKYIFKSFEIDDGEINQVENFLKETFQYN